MSHAEITITAAGYALVVMGLLLAALAWRPGELQVGKLVALLCIVECLRGCAS